MVVPQLDLADAINPLPRRDPLPIRPRRVVLPVYSTRLELRNEVLDDILERPGRDGVAEVWRNGSGGKEGGGGGDALNPSASAPSIHSWSLSATVVGEPVTCEKEGQEMGKRKQGGPTMGPIPPSLMWSASVFLVHFFSSGKSLEEVKMIRNGSEE